MSSSNPYAPPKAVVADEPEQVMPRPRSVTVAVWMLWIEVAMSITVAALNMRNASNTIMLASLLIGTVLWQGLSALLNYKIWRGRNWARITALVLTLLSLLSFAMMLAQPVLDGVKYWFAWSVETSLAIGGLTLDLVALYLVFVPGRAWFRRASPTT